MADMITLEFGPWEPDAALLAGQQAPEARNVIPAKRGDKSVQSLQAVLQVPLGFIYDDPHARGMMHALAKEAVAVANADLGGGFEEDAVIESIETVLRNGRGGYTSIYADLRDGRRTEVDTISGSVIDAAKRLGIPVPCHEMVVAAIHAMEDKAINQIK